MIEVSGRTFARPRTKTAVFCIDGCDPAYLDRALEDRLMPRLARALASGGVYVRGRGQMPSFTNPNNMSIATGQPPSVHGISGNYYFDSARGEEVPMNEPRFLRAPTIFEAMEARGTKTLCVSAKDKLRALLGATTRGGPAPMSLSAERAHEQSVFGESVLAIVGKKNPSIYDWDISHYAMEIGLAIHERASASLVYVSLTDFVQHKEGPRGEMANRFYARFDELLGAYIDVGFACGITADHGMNDKTRADGSPNVRYLEDVLTEAGVSGARVLLPITDPYVVHHGALGSFATVYVAPAMLAHARRALASLPGVELVLERAEAAARFELPADRIGDLVVLGDCSTVLGKSAAYHDLSAVARGLRSHGGLHEAHVPIVSCVPLREGATLPRTNADVFDMMLNGLAPAPTLAHGDL